MFTRVVRVTNEGCEMEADHRHAEIIIESQNVKEAKGVSSLCEKKTIGG